MSVEMRKEVAAAVREARAALDRVWASAPVGDGTDPELDRVIAGPVLSAESHLWDASAALVRLAEGEEVNA